MSPIARDLFRESQRRDLWRRWKFRVLDSLWALSMCACVLALVFAWWSAVK